MSEIERSMTRCPSTMPTMPKGMMNMITRGWAAERNRLARIRKMIAREITPATRRSAKDWSISF